MTLMTSIQYCSKAISENSFGKSLKICEKMDHKYRIMVFSVSCIEDESVSGLCAYDHVSESRG